jgi:septal ring factor EnvC (AmiA/AmiB activator)
MLETTFLMEAGRLLGVTGFFGAILFIIWWITHKAANKQIETISHLLVSFHDNLSKQSDQQLKSMTAQYDRMLEMQKTIHQNNYELLKEILELQRIQTQTLAHLEVKVDSNQFCPILRKENR